MRRFGLAVFVLFPVLFAACGGDAISPSDSRTPGVVVMPPQVSPIAGECSAAEVRASISVLMGALTPNDNSALSKFADVERLMGYNHPDSTARARQVLESPLLSFIQNKFDQASPANQAAYADELAELKVQLYCFVGLFTIPTSNTPKVVALANGTAGIWFPEGFCDGTCPGINVELEELIACTSPGVPTGCVTPPLGTLLDKYGNFLRVTLSGGTPNLLTDDSPIVAMCAPAGTEGILQGLRVGHQDDGTSNTLGFTILDPVGIPPELDDLLICDTFASNDIPAAPGSMFARMVNHLVDFLLPEKATATRMMLGGLGIGGTTRTFSPFGIINTTLGAVGGTGGTTRQFSPSNPDAPAATPALATGVDGNLVDTVDYKQLTDLPGVYVKTGQGTAIPGATVTFSMLDPVTAPYVATPSDAFVCDVNGATQTSIVVETDANGFAALECVNFGSTLGFKNLQAVIDPSTAEGIAGDGIDEVTVTACDPICGVAGATTSLNWLVTTTTGNPAKLTLESMATTAAAGATFLPQPVLNVRDRLNNLVLTNSVVVTATATPPAGGTGGLINNSTPTSASGVVTFSNLGIGGTAGVWGVTFSSGTLTPASANITITTGPAATIQTYMPPGPTAGSIHTYTTGLTPGGLASPAPTVIVKDAYGNPVSGTPLTWSPLLGSNGSVLDIGSGGTTTATGTAQVGSWTFGDGLSQVAANITALPDGTPAQFSASTPTGVPNFSCLVGSSKRDLVPWSVPRPNSAVKEVTIWMSVTGQSNLTQPYPATLRVYENSASFTSPTGIPARIVNGSVLLPGNNGSPTAVTFSLPTSLPRISGNNTLYFRLSITAPDNRKFQLWYASSGFNNSSDCAKVLMYPSYPTVTPTVKGMRIQLTN